MKRKRTDPKTEVKTRTKTNTRAPKMPGFLVEPVFKRTRLPVLRLDAENSEATETPPVANTVNNDNNHHRNNTNSISKQITYDQDKMVAILVQAGWKVTGDKDPVYTDLRGRTYQCITKAFCVLINLVQEGKAKRKENSAYKLVQKEELRDLIRALKMKEVHENNYDEQCCSDETETPPVATTVNNDNNHHHNNYKSLSKQIMHDQDKMVAILVQAGWNVTGDTDPVYTDLQGRTYQCITKAFCVLVNLVKEGKAKRKEDSAYNLVPKEELRDLIRSLKMKEVHENNNDEQCGSNETDQDSGVRSVEGTSKVNSNDVQKDDKITDVLCNVCGDHGDLAICDGCQSTFHERCLDIQELPSGKWYCPYCLCKFCKTTFGARKPRAGALISEMMSCSLCEEKFHISCFKMVKTLNMDSGSLYFCGTKCFEIHTKLKESFGKKTQLQDGFSFTLLKDYDMRKRINKLDPIKAECKPKLAKAFEILEQCFQPAVDEIGRVNIIRHLVYNQGLVLDDKNFFNFVNGSLSQTRRLNHSGFFTAILENDHEVISTATLRIHGNKLAEMPFVGTLIEYRGQGMCRRLLDSIEQVLGSFGVEELVIPSAEDTLQIWTKLGFKPLKKSIKQKMKSMSMVVFAGTTILQKRIPKK